MRSCIDHSLVMQNETKTTLVLGGNGKTGRRVATRLAARGVPVRVASRSSSPRFDWTDATTWRAAFEGVHAAYVAYHPDLAAPGAAAVLRDVARVAVESGVRRIVLLSGRGEPQAEVSEEAVRESGADLTVLRAAWFAQNFSEGAFADSVAGGEISLPGPGDVGEPFIDAEDIADVAVAALLDDAHIGKTWELTGPRLVTLDEAAAELSAASGRPVRYVPVTTGDFAHALTEYVGVEYATFLGELFAFLLDGHNSHLTDHVERVLGRTPRDFRDYAADAKRAGVWTR
jgi:uncharacterized protein YbjT (DUF2867 family)